MTIQTGSGPRKRGKTSSKTNETTQENTTPSLRYGPMPRFPHQRVWSRGIIICGVMIYIWYFSKVSKETVLASHKDTLQNRGQQFECDTKYLADMKHFPQCKPSKCGRYVTDVLLLGSEARKLLEMAKAGFALSTTKGSASIFDIHSGAITLNDKFVNIHTVEGSKTVFKKEFLIAYKMVKDKIQRALAQVFQVDHNSLHLTHPTFFSKLTDATPLTKHDEYWHVHVDKETYQAFHYTSLVYLSDFGKDFQGGRFIFSDEMEGEQATNITVEPRFGRVSMFSSGAENTHFVERVTQGTRYAITVSFTCDKKHSIAIPESSST